MQQRLWFLDRLAPGLATYNMPFALELNGSLDRAALARALAEVVRRQEALRTVIRVVDDQPVQAIDPKGTHALATSDVSELPLDLRARELEARLLAEARQPFDLSRGPLFRATLHRLADDRHVLAITVHHIVFDGWSTGVLYRELFAAYEAFAAGRAPSLPELTIQYSDFATWQRRELTDAALEPQLAYWKHALAGAPALLELPTDRPRPAVQSHRGAVRARVYPVELLERARAFSREAGVTLFTTLLAAFQVLLQRYCQKDDVVVGSPITNRGRLELEPLCGFFVNTVVLRTDLSRTPTFRELVARTRETVLGATDNQDAPLDRLVEALNPVRSQSYSPLFQVLFQADEHEGAHIDGGGGVRVRERWTASMTAKFDLSLAMAETQDGLRAAFEYATDLFDSDTVERMLDHLGVLLAAALASPDERIGRLPLVTDAERRQLLVEWNGSAREYAGTPVHEVVAAQAASAPDAPAVTLGDQSLSYRELDRRANQLAHHLLSLCQPRSLIALAFEPSLEMAVAVLGVLKAGCACVPLDPSYPRERLAQQMIETRAPVLLTQDHLAGRVPLHDATLLRLDRDTALIAQAQDTDPGLPTSPDDLAYVVYTSGSTGRPKGTSLPHRVLANLIAWHQEVLPGAPRLLQFAPLSFDMSFYELFVAWCAGGTLFLGEPQMRQDPELLADTIARHRIDRVMLPVVVLTQLAEQTADEPARLAPLRHVISAGEQLRVTGDLTRLFGRLPQCRLHNHYGPSETHVVTAYSLPERVADWPRLPPIGRPIANTQVYVVDENDEPVPVGVPGELCIGGHALGAGYLEQPDLTAERFPENPFGGGRVYRTGDLGRWRPGGELEFLGRLDAQVKLRGMRVELGEVEAVIAQHPEVKEAVVVVRDDVLVAYVVPAGAMPPTSIELRSHLSRKLPAHMVPSGFVSLRRLPLTPRGKVDRKALPAPQHQIDDVSYLAPRNEAEARIAEIWAQLLGLERVGVKDNFFEIGGHSLLATQAVARISRAFGVRLMVRRLFEVPTVAEIAEEIARLAGGAPGAPGVARRVDPSVYPLSHIQERALSAHRGSPDSPDIVPLAYVLAGPLDRAALERAATELMRRHEILRARFHFDGERYTETLGPVESPLVVHDLGGDPATLEDRAVVHARTAALERVDLENGPLFRLWLLPVTADKHVIMLFVHHAIWDGVSAENYVSELTVLHDAYRRGEPSPLPELPFQYADFAAWQRSFYESPDGAAQISWWKQHVEGAQAPRLPVELPREPVEAKRREVPNHAFPRGVEILTGGSGLFARVQACARRHLSTPYEVLLTAFVAWLARVSGQDELAFCTQHQNRHIEGTSRLVGPFAQALVVRADVASNPSFAELLERVRRVLLAARARADVCGPFMGLSRYRVNFNYFPRLVGGEPHHDGLAARPWRPIDPGRTLWYDLTLHSTVIGDELSIILWHNLELWRPETARRWASEYATLLDRIVAQPELRLRDLKLE